MLFPGRRWLQDPRKILSPYISEGMVVLEPGSAMGYFTLEMARLVGPAGRVIAVDTQSRELEILMRRARRAGLADRIETRVATATRLNLGGLDCKVDFAFVFAMAHEVDEPDGFFREIYQTIKPGGRMLLSEPVRHVTLRDFVATQASAEQAGFVPESQPKIRASQSVLFAKKT